MRTAMKSPSAPLRQKTATWWLRWVAVLVLLFCAGTGLIYSVQPRSVALCLFFLLVVAGAKLAPRFRIATAVVLAAVLIAHSYWGHVLALAPEGMTNAQLFIRTLTGHHRHFTLEALGPVLAVVYVFWSERTNRRRT
jgi:hypothetical protein